MTINPAYRSSELLYALKASGSRALVLAERFKSSDYVSLILDLAPELEGGEQGVKLAQLPDLEFVIGLGRTTSGMLTFAQFLEGATDCGEDRLREAAQAATADDLVCIQFTSGTTGPPKGASLTHFGLLNNGAMTLHVMGVQRTDRICIPVPLFHCFGLVVGVLGSLAHGATMVFPGEGFDPSEVLSTIEQERCTALYGVPTMFIAELSHPDFEKFDLTSLRTGIMGAAPCPEDVMRKVMTDMHMADVTIAFGMTETSPVSFQTRCDADVETRTSTVGTVHPWVEARVANNDGQPVPIGEVGELQIRGYSVMRGYWGEPEKTADAVDPAGWMHTGDLAVMDVTKRCRIVGRLKDVVIRGGENIYPVEVENFLRSHEAIHDVAVFGTPDELMGEEACAWIKTTREITLDDIREHCAERIAYYKVPRFVRFVDEFPMTASGKMHKPTMREQERSGELEGELLDMRELVK